ncbi:MAG: cell division protein ZapA [Alphaproteobacteria bacterium]
MPSVSVTINGKSYRMACDEGQEQHLIDLGDQLNATIDELRGAFGEIGDQRLIVMAAISKADELSEERRRVQRLEEALDQLREAGGGAEMAAAIEGAAARIGDIARKLNAER